MSVSSPSQPADSPRARAATGAGRDATTDALTGTITGRARAKDRAVAGLVVVLGGATAILFSVGQWRMLQVPSWDLAIFSQLAKAYAAGQAPIVPIKGEGFNLLGDHFHPLLIVLGPLWRLWPSPLMLLILQDLLLAISAWPLVRLATDQLRRARLPLPRLWAALLGGAYVCSWGLQGAVAAQFHEIAFAVPLLAWGSAAYVRRRYLASALWLAPLILIKEDLGLTVMLAGLVIAWTAWREAHMPDGKRSCAGGTATPGGPQLPSSGEPVRSATSVRSDAGLRFTQVPGVRTGLLLAFFGLAAFLLTVLVLLPTLSPTDAWQYGLSGNANDGSQVTASGGNLLARVFSPPVKLATLLLLALTAGGIGLASPWMLLVLPTLAWRFLSPKSTYWVWDYWHYNAVLMPIAFAALFDGMLCLRRWMRRGEGVAGSRVAEPHVAERPAGAPTPATHDSADSPGSAGSACVPSFLQPKYSFRIVALIAVLMPVITGLVISPSLPYAWMTSSNWGHTSSRMAAVEEIERLITTGTSNEFQLSSAAGNPVETEADSSGSTGSGAAGALSTGRDTAGAASTGSGSTSAPASASQPTVLSDLTLLARLVPSAEVYWMGTSTTATEFVVVDTYSSSWGGRAPSNAAQWTMSRTGSHYELVYERDGFQVARRVSPALPAAS